MSDDGCAPHAVDASSDKVEQAVSPVRVIRAKRRVRSYSLSLTFLYWCQLVFEYVHAMVPSISSPQQLKVLKQTSLKVTNRDRETV